jgi:hypothetical protein
LFDHSGLDVVDQRQILDLDPIAQTAAENGETPGYRDDGSNFLHGFAPCAERGFVANARFSPHDHSATQASGHQFEN